MAKRKDPLFLIYAFVIFWTMCVSNGLSFTRYLPSSIFFVIDFSIPLFYMLTMKLDTNPKNIKACIWVVIIGLYSLGVSYKATIFSYLSPFMFIIGTCSVILLPYQNKLRLFRFITNGVTIILCVSIPFWLLHLAGFALPHGAPFEHENGFHELIDYYVFFESAKPSLSLFQRYSSVFLEPGQLASVCALLFFANGSNLKNWKNLLFLFATILSFSLIGYGLFVGGLLLNSIFSHKKGRFLKIAVFVTIVGGITYFTLKAASEDNPLYSLIFQRLEYDEQSGSIAGNNRTSEDFDLAFDQLMKTNNKWLGVGWTMEPGNNWAVNCSGYKKYIVFNGIIGLFMLIAFVFSMMRHHLNYKTFILFVVAVVAFLVRDMLRSQFWLFIVILGFYLQGPLPKWKRRKFRVNHPNSPVEKSLGIGKETCEIRPVI